MTFSDSFIVFFIEEIKLRELIFEELFKGALEWRNFLLVRMPKGLCVSRVLWRWGGFLRGPQVSTVGLTECSKFLGVQAFGSLKDLNEWDVY